jgi:4-hydroxythreonine-4-phosphate dehydrogenase
MGDPVGIGPEIILSALCNPLVYKMCRPVVMGDIRILNAAQKTIGSDLAVKAVSNLGTGIYQYGCVDVITLSALDPDKTFWGRPTLRTGRAMIDYITEAIELAMRGDIAAMVTCPINKRAMQMAGSQFEGHTELLAERTKSDNFVMMLAGDRLRVALVTIHTALRNVPDMLSEKRIVETIRITGNALQKRFGCKEPRIAVAGLNPHAGEGGLFGEEEKNIIAPAVKRAVKEGCNVSGPFPPDTIFYHAEKGHYEVVICMYHDQGLIPFKMIHFNDGVNITLGLPIIRTSVDHGTAYDIAGTGRADPGSLITAINMAVEQAVCVRNNT